MTLAAPDNEPRVFVAAAATRRDKQSPFESPGKPSAFVPLRNLQPALKSGTPAITRKLPPSLVLPAPDPQTARVAPDDERKLKFGSSNFDTFAPEHLSTGATEVVVAD
ncbi:hypothetical protein MYCTH_2122680 [Thermothelomyces thermophilus ATCC 42464]|uniref:Uncharacterized protein n=1 Tax=Thermothelomyces thermophilus (strain ATCC 42464 / BCRC 31852 / DSM 1799) TaxID=573729 RepID=G2Q5T1_THET4|nr:uncharacterized protein MYCTH_2122680 [Thermothelomyces thermophilus ATCC 42464]AEO53807.1 hypothetical protein MYCTH_2122680 [Thermothelomyces thermophilus ATCC 42464]